MKKRWGFLLGCCLLLFSLCAATTLAEGADAALSWHGHQMEIDEITDAQAVVAEVFSSPTPADGYLLVARLRAADGSRVSAEEVAAYADEFLLTYGAGGKRRPFHSAVSSEGEGLDLVFYMNGADDADYAPFSSLRFGLSVSPLSTASDELMNTVLVWHGHSLEVELCTNDEATLSGRPRPEQGYWVLTRLRTSDGSPVTAEEVTAYASEIVLTDGAQGSYRLAESFSAQESPNFSW